MDPVVLSLDLPGLKKVASGKVREIFDCGEYFLFVASDRISAFDCIMPQGIPGKGRILTKLSEFWFDFFEKDHAHHWVSSDLEDLPESLAPFHRQLDGRFMLVKKLKMIPVECVVRGYLVGSGYKEYRQSGTVCGLKLPEGLELASKLDKPIFTPAAKNHDGHDENISFEKMVEMVGAELAAKLRDKSIDIYNRAFEHAQKSNVIIADTKFEFGLLGDEIVLADEVLTPDSSRYWPAAEVVLGKNPPSFDKQFLRDYLDGLDWDKNPPAPTLPEEILEGTGERYKTCFNLVTNSPQ